MKHPRNNRLKPFLDRHGIQQKALREEMNKGLDEGNPDWVPQSTMASWTCAGGGGINVPELPMAQRVVKAIRRKWRLDATAVELFPDLKLTAEQMRRLTK